LSNPFNDRFKTEKKIYFSIRENPHFLGHYFGFTKLSQIHSDWIKYLFFTDGNKSIQAHRESYKTTSIIVGIILLFLINPDVTILLVRKTETLASEVLYMIQKILESEKCKKLFSLFYDFESLIGENWSKLKFDLSIKKKFFPDSNLTAVGCGASITGRHPDMIIVDDIITIEDRYSKAEREKTKNYIMELLNIVKDSGKILFTGTPWHQEDAWNIIEKIVPEIKKFSIYDTDIISQEKINLLRAGMSSSLFACNYELMHIRRETVFFPEPIYSEWNTNVHNLAFLDPAYGGSNYTALSIGGIVNNEYIQVRGYIWKKNVSSLYQEIINLLNKFNVGTIVVESNADKGYCARDLYKLRGNHGVKPFTESINKHVRIENTVLKNWDRIRFANDIDRDYLSQVISYIEGEEPDDAPDSLSGLIRVLTIVKRKSFFIN